MVEKELGLTSYHLRLVPWWRRTSDESLALLLLASEALAERAERAGFVFYVAGQNGLVRYIPAVVQDLDAPIIYQDAEGKEASFESSSRKKT